MGLIAQQASSSLLETLSADDAKAVTDLQRQQHHRRKELFLALRAQAVPTEGRNYNRWRSCDSLAKKKFSLLIHVTSPLMICMQCRC